MDGNGTEMPNARQQELDYETRAAQIREHIVQLITSFAEIEAEAEDLRPTVNDDLERLAELEDRIRNNIADLQSLSPQYDQLVAEWNQLDEDHGIMTSDSPWTRSMFAFRKKCLNAKSNRPTLPTRVLQLTIVFDGMIADIAGFREDLEADNAEDHSPPVPGYLVQSPASVAGSRTTHFVARETPRRVQFAITAHSAEATNHRGNPAASQPPPAPNGAPSNQLTLFNPLRVFEMAWRYVPSFGFGSTQPPAVQTPTSYSASTTPAPTPATVRSPRSATLSTPGSRSSVASQRPTPKPRTNLRRAANGVPIVTQLNHGDSTPATPENDRTTTRHASHGHSSDGVMNFTDPHDGNIHNTRSMAWERTYNPVRDDRPLSRSHFYSDSTTAAPAASSRPSFPPKSDAAPTGSRPHSGPAPTGPTPHFGENPARFETYELPPYVPPTRTSTSSEVDRMAEDFTSLAAGRGSDGSPQIATPLTADTDAAPKSAAPSSGPPESISTTSTKDTTTSLFYKNARFTGYTGPPGTKPANLVLQSLPLEPFEGDRRAYPVFRDSFLEMIESQAHLSPRQKLQYLLHYLRGVPLQMAKGFVLSDESYFEATDMLEKRYGDVVTLQNLLMQDLVDIPSPSVKLAELASFHQSAFQIVQSLKQSKLDLGQSRVVQQLLLGKLPPTIKVKILDKATEEPVTPTFILDELLSYINSQQRAHTSGLVLHRPTSSAPNASRPRSNSRPRSPGPTFGQGGNNVRPNYNNGTYVADTENTYVVSRQQRRQQCAFCGENHWSARCTVFPTVALRTRRLQALKQCFLCLGGGHWSTLCPHRAKETCKHCQKGQHHAAICRTFMGESRPGTPTSAPAQSLNPSGGSEPRLSGGPAARPTTPHPSGGHASQPTGGEAKPSRPTPAKAVTGKEASGAATAKPVRQPSTQNSLETGSGNSTSNRKPQRRKNNNKKGTTSSRQNGTLCHAAAASDENTMQKSDQACDDAGLLPGHQALLQTGRCSNTNESAYVDRKTGYDPGEITGIPEVDCQLYVRDLEELSLPDCAGHCSDPEIDDFEAADDSVTLSLCLKLKRPQHLLDQRLHATRTSSRPNLCSTPAYFPTTRRLNKSSVG